MRTRFAPSPTGYSHIGNMRTMIVQYLFTLKNNGEFLLRFDDTDVERGKQEFQDSIFEDLKWFNIEYKSFFKQSDRLALYEKAKQELIAKGRIYPCYETTEEIEIMRKSMTARGVAPIYNRQALKLHPDQIKDFEKQGRKPHYRFLLEDKDISWNDLIKENVCYRGLSFSDPVVFRENGMPLYTFTSVVDDIDTKITHIIRGEDHVTNTAIQIQIFEALGAEIPTFAHLTSIMVGNFKMSKRKGDFSIRKLRTDGFESLAALNYMNQLGTGKDDLYFDLEEISKYFAIENLSKAPARYEYDELKAINSKLLSLSSFDQVKERLKSLNLNITAEFWDAIKGNIQLLQDVGIWIEICEQPIKTLNDGTDKEFLFQAADLLPEMIDITTWDKWIELIKANTQRKGKELFMPIRKALTGQEHGPELKKLLPFINRSEIINRLIACI